MVVVLLREYQVNTANKRVFKMKKVSRILSGIFLYILTLMNAVRKRIQIIVNTIAERVS